MFVYQLTVVHQLLPPLEGNINKLVAELQGDRDTPPAMRFATTFEG